MTGGGPRPTLSAFGLSLLSDVPPPGAWEARPLEEPSLEISLVSAEEIEERWSGFDAIGWGGVIDGAPFLVERGLQGDHRFVHGAAPDQHGVPTARTRALHYLCADVGLLLCAPSDSEDPSWWRVVLDSVLFSVALLQGYEALHAGAIATPAGVIAITAAAGGGKSTLLTELLGRGPSLMADDVLVLKPQGAKPPLAYPAPPLMTVPAARIPASSDTGPLDVISAVEEERWIAAPVHREPLPLRALVVLDRRPNAQTEPGAELTKIESPFSPLLDSLMRFPRTPERERARFELASALASTTSLWRLTASLDTPPDALADVLLGGEL